MHERTSAPPALVMALRFRTQKLPHIDSMVACFARSRVGIDFDSIDKEPVKLFFALLVPNNSAGLAS